MIIEKNGILLTITFLIQESNESIFFYFEEKIQKDNQMVIFENLRCWYLKITTWRIKKEITWNLEGKTPAIQKWLVFWQHDGVQIQLFQVPRPPLPSYHIYFVLFYFTLLFKFNFLIFNYFIDYAAVSYTHLTLPTTGSLCRSRWSPYH